MASYSQVNLTQAIGLVSSLVDDPVQRYWTPPEITLAIQEALFYWGALTNYWRARGSFNLVPNAPTPFVDLSQVLPNLRARTWTLGQMVTDIQYMLLENPSGISGSGGSGQVGIGSILSSILRARNRFVLDTHLPISIHESFGNPPSPSGTFSFPQSSVFVHRADWQDLLSGVWTNLWREDEWALDRANPVWTIETSKPQVYSEAVLSPLTLQLSPAPVAAGSLEALTVDSLAIDLTSPASTFAIPDEWVHAVKYAALSDLLTSESQLHDPLRAQYAESRYQQSVQFASDARSIIRLMVEGLPLPIDSMVSVDAGIPQFRNQPGTPYLAGVLYDLICPVPGIPSRAFGITADVVQSAPVPIIGTDFIPVGFEDLDHIVNYASHVLTFKCGGKEFTETIPGYDAFMSAVASRKNVNSAKIRYLTPLFNQPQVEWAARPDRVVA